MNNFFKLHKKECAIFLLALLLRLALFFISFYANRGDLAFTISGADDYFAISRNLFLGHGFSAALQAPFLANILRPPLYPFFAAGVFSLFKTYWAIVAFQIVISAITPVLGYGLVKKIFGSERISLLTGSFLAVQPYGVVLSYVFMTETIFIFLFLICLNYLFKYFDGHDRRSIVLSGFFLGLSVLTRPVIQYLPIVIVLFIFWHFRHKLKTAFYHSSLLLAIFLLSLSPWLYRNYGLYGTLGLTSQSAYNFYTYFVPSVLAIERQTPFPLEREKMINTEMSNGNVINLANSGQYMRGGWRIIRNYPSAAIRSFSMTLVTFFSHDDGIAVVLNYFGVPAIKHFSGPVFTELLKSPASFPLILIRMLSSGGAAAYILLLARLFWILLACLFLVATFRMIFGKEKIKTQYAFSILLVFYFAFASAINGFGINARFRMPVEIFIFSFAFYRLLNKCWPSFLRFKIGRGVAKSPK